MNAPFFVEILSRNEKVQFRHQVSMLPISVGRAYDNDVILDDPHISAHHALIDQTADGKLVIRDLDSHNGIIYKASRQAEIPIDGNIIFRLGQTLLRVRFADFPVAPEITDTANYEWDGWRPALAGLAIIVLLTIFITWAVNTKKFELINYLAIVALTLVLGLIWCGVWAFVSRLFGGRARLGRHLFILACGFVAVEFWSILSAVVAYAFSLEIFTHYGSHVIIAIGAAMIFFHLLTVNPGRRRSFALTCVMLAVLGSGLVLMYNYSSRGQLADELFMTERLPPVVRKSADMPVAKFIGNAKKLKTRADAERARYAGADEEDSEDQN